jgi:hypothetical protein
MTAPSPSSPPSQPYADWKAPADDGQVLIWPSADKIRAATHENSRLLSAATTCLQNIPVPLIRRALRQWIGHTDDAQPLIATGHQIELYHAGVWAKDIFINRLASELSGSAYHFAIDTDAPKHLNLRWPGTSLPITDDPRLSSAAWAGLIETPTPAHLSQLEAQFKQAAAEWDFQPLMGSFLASLKRLTLDSSNLTWALTNAIHQLDWNLGLRHNSLLVSPLWSSPGYLVFVHHILARPDQFAAHYNSILADYRAANCISSPGRPWPDLRRSPDECEVPFWLDSLETARRSRATVSLRRGVWTLILDGKFEFPFDPHADGWTAADSLAKFLSQSGLRLSPRALTLTLFLRLFLADQFVHGIGGARYDQITDRVIERFFCLPAPAFTVATATLLFPAAVGRRPVGLHPLLQEGRRLQHASADPQKLQMANQIAALPRHSPQRRELFQQMHSHFAAALHAPQYLEWQNRLAVARQIQSSQHDLFDREFFFALQPESRLAALIAKCEGVAKSEIRSPKSE